MLTVNLNSLLKFQYNACDKHFKEMFGEKWEHYFRKYLFECKENTLFFYWALDATNRKTFLAYIQTRWADGG